MKGLKKEESKDVPKKNKEHSEVEVLRTYSINGQKSLLPIVYYIMFFRAGYWSKKLKPDFVK